MPVFRRLPLAAGLLAGLIGLSLTGTAGAAQHDGTVTLRGTYQLLVADTVPQAAGTSGHRYRSELHTRDTTYHLRLPAGIQLKGGTGVSVTGTLSGKTLTADSVAPIAALTEAPVAITENTNVLVILAEWNRPDSVTQSSAQTEMFTKTANWYSSASYGATTQHGVVTPWLHITGPAGNKCYADSDSILSRAQAAAAARGYHAADYDRTVVYFPYNNGPGSDCVGLSGWAYQPGSIVWLNGHMDTRVTVHEQGHNYGLAHAHSYRCSTGALTGSCTFSDYGDDYDAMGASALKAQFSAKQKVQLGWMPATTLTLGTSTTLAPLEKSTGVRGAVVHATASRDYWLEYRQRIAEDATLPVGATNGVLIHVVDKAISTADGTTVGPALLDSSPADRSLADATLKAGQSWVTPEGFRLAVGAVTAAGAAVSMTSPRPAVADFNGDRRSDAAVYRPSTTTWYPQGSASVVYGATTDVPVAADYNGDGRTDIAVWRPSTGAWWIRGSAAVVWGRNGDIPVPGDYNGDGRADRAVYRPSNKTWYVQGGVIAAYGGTGDVPVAADYNGDRRTDIAVWRPSTGAWWVRGNSPVTYGQRGDIAVPGDYNGDGRSDFAVWRPPASTGSGTWFARSWATTVAGSSGDIPTPGDFSGDGRTDVGVWSRSTGGWAIQGLPAFQWGVSGDIPVLLPPSIRMTQLGSR